MRTFGEAFRIAIEGSIDLLAARSEIKQEFRAGVTIIGSSANNPLKFLPNADGVIMQLVGQHFPGFMKPVPAIREAYDDLRVHQLALMAGIRAAYTEALKRFDPEKMEQEAPRASLLNSLYDGSRKAALWDEYKRNFSKLKDSAEDDLTAFSGQTFVQAYEAAAEAAKGQT
jgi:FHA domain-containing protein